jgi:hypothetical protein
MIAKLLKPLVVAAIHGPVVIVTLPVDANLEFDLDADDDLGDENLTAVRCDGETYLAMPHDLLDAVQRWHVAHP